MPGITGDQMDTLNAIAIQMFEMPFDQLPLEAKKDVLEAARPEERAGGGMMDINRMTVPLGYDNGGDVDLAAIMADMEASRGPAEVTHPIQKIISDRTIVDPYSESQGERLKELGSKGLDALRRLAEETIGAGPAEGSESYLGKEEIIKMETNDLLGELKSMGASHESPLFPDIANRPGNKWKTYNTMKMILDELMSRLDFD
jgi:hypothetical protein